MTTTKDKMDKKILESIECVIIIQKASGTWDYDPYMHGLLNGMMLIEAMITDKKYNPYEAPKRWKHKRWDEKEMTDSERIDKCGEI